MCTRPAWKRPGAIASPTFAAPNVTVTVARTATPGHLAGRRVDAGRDVDRDHRPAARVDQLDHPRGVLSRRVVQADAEQRVDDDVRRAEIADAVDDRDLAARLAQHARADPAVAAVVPLPADDGHAAGELPQDEVGGGRARALHQLLEGALVRLFGAARLVGGEERLQPHAGNATATAAASSRECVIESSIVPAPTFSANAAVRPLRCTPGFGRPRTSISFQVK